jgi:hypothetical protein
MKMSDYSSYYLMNFTTATDANGVDDAPADFLID